MKKNRFLVTVTSAALALSMVGMASADTIGETINNITGKHQQQYEKHIEQGNEVNMDNMMSELVKVNAEKVDEVKEGAADLQKQINRNEVMEPQRWMCNDEELRNKMIEFHQSKQELMLEMHENMPRQQMGHGMMGNGNGNMGSMMGMQRN